MTRGTTGSSPDRGGGDTPEAAVAAARAGVVIRRASTIGDLDALRSVMESIWGPEVVPPRNLLRGMTLAGAPLLLAARGDREVGFALGLLGWADGLHLHSHEVGVLADERGKGVGYALKLTQREMCLSNGIREIRWTFDPLLASNAAFNLARLGVRVTDFLPDCYGEREDAFNAGEVTDRLKVTWFLNQPTTAARDLAAGGGSLVSTGPPRRSATAAAIGTVIPIPRDYQRLRLEDVGSAKAWRAAVACALADVFNAGLTLVEFSRGQYVVGAP